MSARTDMVRRTLEQPDAELFGELGTEDMTFYAAHLGLDLQGRDAVVDAMRKFLGESKPKWQVQGDPVEHGDFVVIFYRATLASGEQRDVCEVVRFAGDKMSAVWTMRG